MEKPSPPARGTGGLLARLLRSRLGLFVALGGALLPLVVLTVLQVRWLGELERASRLARNVTLSKMLNIVEKDIQNFYVITASRLLDIPASYLAEERLASLARVFEKNSLEGVRRVFVISFRAGDLLVWYDPTTGTMVTPKGSPETLAVWTAAAPWLIMSDRKKVLTKSELTVDERERDFPMILAPVLDATGELAGVAGIVLDAEYFEKVLLPRTLADVWPRASEMGGVATPGLRFGAWNGDKRVLFGEPLPGRDMFALRQLSWVFKDIRLGVFPSDGKAVDVTRRAFVANLTLSIAVSGVLLVGLVVIFRVAAREMRLSAMKSDFVSNVSHELRTPLASIRVFGELMRLGRVSDGEKVREYGEFIENESRRLSALVDNILDFSRIESGRKVYAPAETDLESLVRGVVESFSLRTRHQDVAITLRPSPTPLPPLTIDGAAIEQVVANLLDNAIKYSGDSREVEVSVDNDGSHAIIRVTDHGVGIPSDECRRIFERFHRVSTGLVHEVRGTGLGLAIVKHVVQAHGGTVEVESEPGIGSVFSVRMPLTRPGVAPAVDPHPAPEQA